MGGTYTTHHGKIIDIALGQLVSGHLSPVINPGDCEFKAHPGKSFSLSLNECNSD